MLNNILLQPSQRLRLNADYDYDSVQFEFRANYGGTFNYTFRTDFYVPIYSSVSGTVLEFENVFIFGLVDQIFPSNRTIQESNTGIEEERRLFYVAITRAEKELYLSYVDMYNNKIKNISSFIENIKDTINIIKPAEKDLK